MHLSGLPLSLIALLPLVSCAQIQYPLLPEVSASSTTLVDALSADSDYTTLLRLLQRTRLIPTLNTLNGSTFFAPTNDAIARHGALNRLWDAAMQENEMDAMDNINEELRQELLYHLLNETLVVPTSGEVKVVDTLHYPRKKQDPPTHEPPPSPPWMPLPGGTLGGAPQRLRVAGKDEDVLWAGVNFRGNGGTKIVKQKVNVSNGLLLGIGEVLDVPGDLVHVISQRSQLSYFNKLLPKKMLELIQGTPELTLFLPTDKSWDLLEEIERLYLESEFAENDLNNIVNMHAVWMNDVLWSEKLTNGSRYKTLYGSTIDVHANEGITTIGPSTLIEPDIYASNGVLHIVDNLLIPPGTLKLTPEKLLLALNCTKFISLIRSVNLTHLVNSTSSDTPRTILAVTDDVMSLFNDDPDIPRKGSDELKRMVAYHFLPGKWTPKKLKNGMLLETELIEPGLNGGRQVIPVEVQSPLQDDEKVVTGLRFAGAGVIGKPIRVNATNTIIYLLTRSVVPPSDILTTALPFLHFSSFIAAVFSTELDTLLKASPSTTFLIPHNAAFERLGGLISTYLLSSSATAKSDLSSVILHHVIESVQYQKDFVSGSQKSFNTLEGSDVSVQRNDDKSVNIHPSGGWVGMKGTLGSGDILTQTGVLHQVSDILLPRSVEITNSKLVKAAEGSTMANLVVRAGMGWMLNGTAPPEDSDWANEDIEGLGWTLLCPTDDAFKGINLTQLWQDEENLKSLVAQHVIPTPRLTEKGISDLRLAPEVAHQPLPLDTSTVYSTLQSRTSLYGDIIFAPLPDSPGRYQVRIKDWPESQKNASAKVLLWGRCTTNGGTGGVIQIDRLMEPWNPGFWAKYGPPTAGGIGGVCLIGLFFWVVSIIWRRDTREPTYEPVGGFNGNDDGTSN